MQIIHNKIMIIEDNKDLQEIYKHSFEKYGYQVILAGDGEAGIEGVAKVMPDVILLDLMMPGLDGFGFLRAMKDLGGLSIPVVVCSNISDVETLNRVLREGAQAVLLKVDYSGKQLVEKVTHIVEEFYKKKK